MSLLLFLQLLNRQDLKTTYFCLKECLLCSRKKKVLMQRYMWGFHPPKSINPEVERKGLWELARVKIKGSSQLGENCRVMHQNWNFTALGPDLQRLWPKLDDCSGAWGMCLGLYVLLEKSTPTHQVEIPSRPNQPRGRSWKIKTQIFSRVDIRNF